jgi:hypothetical protein
MDTKAISIRLNDATGNLYRWTVKRVPHVWNCLPLGKSHYISGWEFIDHDGVARFAEGNWRDLVALFKQTAENYGFTPMSDLS